MEWPKASDILQSIAGDSAGLEWVVIIFLFGVALLIWKALETLVPEAAKTLLHHLTKKLKTRSAFAAQEATVREHVREQKPDWFVTSLPSLNDYRVDARDLPDIYEPPPFEIMESQHTRVVQLRGVMQSYRSFALVGDPVSGKSTTLLFLARVYANEVVEQETGVQESRLPLLLRAEDIREHDTLPQSLQRTLKDGGRNVDTQFLEAQLKIGRCFIFLDGLDETPEAHRRAWLLQWIRNALRENQSNRFIVSCRLSDWIRDPILELPVVRALDFTGENVSSFCDKWSTELGTVVSVEELPDVEDPIHGGLVRNPLYLTLLILLGQRGGPVPERIEGLYELFTHLMVAEWDETKSPGATESALRSIVEKRVSFLGSLAQFLLGTGRTDIELDDDQCVSACLEAANELSIESKEQLFEVFNDSVARGGLLYRKSWGVYSFRLRVFQEYLAARYLDKSKTPEHVLTLLQLPDFLESVRWYARLTPDIDEFSELLLDRNDAEALAVVATGVSENPRITESVKLRCLEFLKSGFNQLLENGIGAIDMAPLVFRLDAQYWSKRLKRLVSEGSSKLVKTQAASCLVATQRTDAFESLLEALASNRSNIETRKLILKAMGGSRLSSTREFLWEEIKSECEQIGEVAQHALVEIGSKSLRDSRNVLESDAHETQKKAAVNILCELEGPRAIGFLQSAGSQQPPEINFFIVENLRTRFFPETNDLTLIMGGVMDGTYPRLIKPILDRFAASVMILIMAPVLLVVTTALLFSRGPIFYKKVQVGRGGQEYFAYKYRTLVLADETDGPLFTLSNDARVTRLGTLLRKTQIDEIPQLFLVLTGDVSLVGPRAHRPTDLEVLSTISPVFDVREVAKPGLTGLAQLMYRYDGSVEQLEQGLVKDLEYVAKCSFWLDTKILFKAVTRSLSGRYQY